MPRSNPDPAPPSGTATRAELLRARGYDDAVVNGNGTTPTQDLATEWPESPAEELVGIEGPADDQGERRCPMCGKELPTSDPRRVYCSRTCRNRAGEVARGRHFELASPQLATVLDAMLATGAEVTTTVAGFTLTARRA